MSECKMDICECHSIIIIITTTTTTTMTMTTMMMKAQKPTDPPVQSGLLRSVCTVFVNNLVAFLFPFSC
jgi:magnesium-transporting ATPase (P-type)